jgi:hypothetical protein
MILHKASVDPVKTRSLRLEGGGSTTTKRVKPRDPAIPVQVNFSTRLTRFDSLSLAPEPLDVGARNTPDTFADNAPF